MSVNTGVVIGRFQCHKLHKGHVRLLKEVYSRHTEVVILVGVSPLRSTERNPLTFDQRRVMLLQHFPGVTIKPIYDVNSDAAWSAQVDGLLPGSATLYGGRDSFIPHYTGAHRCEYLDLLFDVSATSIRDRVTECYRDTADFRAGVEYGAKNRWVNPVPCVDVAIVNHGEVLLGRKKDSTLFQFIGGFVDPGESWEDAAYREVREETGLHLSVVKYLTSSAIEDWRYAKEASGITTSFYVGEYVGGDPVAGDDVEEVRWFNFREDVPIIKSHEKLLNILRGMYRL